MRKLSRQLPCWRAEPSPHTVSADTFNGIEARVAPQLPVRVHVYGSIAIGLLGAVLLQVACGEEKLASSAYKLVLCRQNSDCNNGLICALGACRAECRTAVDCGGGACVTTEHEQAVCQPLPEKNTPCSLQSDCPSPLACATDYRCRNLCETADDCNVYGAEGRDCASDASGVRFCADAAEVSGGLLIAEPPAGAPSTPVERLQSAPGTADGPSIATLVGPEGGTVGIRSAVINIPAGALTQAVEVRVTEQTSGPDSSIGPSYAIEPVDLVLVQPARLVFTYGDDSEGVALALCTVVGRTCEVLPGSVQDVERMRVTASVTTLGSFALREVPLGSSEGGVIDAGAMDAGSLDSGGDAHPDSSVPHDGGTAGDATTTPDASSVDSGPCTDAAVCTDGD